MPFGIVFVRSVDVVHSGAAVRARSRQPLRGRSWSARSGERPGWRRSRRSTPGCHDDPRRSDGMAGDRLCRRGRRDAGWIDTTERRAGATGSVGGEPALFGVAAVAWLPVSSLAAAAPDRDKHGELTIDVLSSAPEQVSGGDALVRVEVPRTVPLHQVTLTLDGVDVTEAFSPVPGERALVGLVDGLDLGANVLRAAPNGRGRGRPAAATVTLVNHPISGPIFSGPQQQPFVCTTARATFDGRRLLGQPLVDNQDQFGIPVAAEAADGSYPSDGRGYPTAAATIVGWSKDCSATTRVTYAYKTTGGQFRHLADPGQLPARRRHHDDARRSHRPLRGALGAGHDQPVHLQRRHAGADVGDRSCPAGRLAVERPAGVQPPGRRGDRPYAGHDQSERDAARAGAGTRLRRRQLDRLAHEHPLQPAARRRDGAHAEGALHRGPRRPGLHRGRRRIGRRHPAVRVRPEPPGAAGCGDPAVLLLRTWSPRPSTSATASCSSTTST